MSVGASPVGEWTKKEERCTSSPFNGRFEGGGYILLE